MTKCQRAKKRFKSLDRIHHSNGCCSGDTCVLKAEPGDEKIAKNLKRNLHNGTLGGAKGQRLVKPGGPGNICKVMIILKDNITESFMKVPFFSFVYWSKGPILHPVASGWVTVLLLLQFGVVDAGL